MCLWSWFVGWLVGHCCLGCRYYDVFPRHGRCMGFCSLRGVDVEKTDFCSGFEER